MNSAIFNPITDNVIGRYGKFTEEIEEITLKYDCSKIPYIVQYWGTGYLIITQKAFNKLKRGKFKLLFPSPTKKLRG